MDNDGESSPDTHSKEPPAAPQPLRPELPATSSPTETPVVIPAWRIYIHLYLPLLVSTLLIPFGRVLVLQWRASSDRIMAPYEWFMPVAVAALPTYLLGSLAYPTNRPPPTPEESIRWSRKSDLYRIIVLFTYGRVFGTPFNAMYFFGDLVFSNMADALVGERPAGTKQRKSEFFIAALWVLASGVLWQLAPSSLGFYMGMVDRTLWRTAYVALVDDVIGILTRPNVKTFMGKLVLVIAQAVLMVGFVALVSRKTNLLPIWPCMKWDEDLLATYACYNSIKLNDPNFLRQQAACFDFRNLHVSAAEAARRLAAGADQIAATCVGVFEGSQEEACMLLNGVAGKKTGAQFEVLGYCPGFLETVGIVQKCASGTMMPMFAELAQRLRTSRGMA